MQAGEADVSKIYVRAFVLFSAFLHTPSRSRRFEAHEAIFMRLQPFYLSNFEERARRRRSQPFEALRGASLAPFAVETTLSPASAAKVVRLRLLFQ